MNKPDLDCIVHPAKKILLSSLNPSDLHIEYEENGLEDTLHLIDKEFFSIHFPSSDCHCHLQLVKDDLEIWADHIKTIWLHG